VRFFFGALGSLTFFSFLGLPASAPSPLAPFLALPFAAAILPLPFPPAASLPPAGSILVTVFSLAGFFAGRSSASAVPLSFRLPLLLNASAETPSSSIISASLASSSSSLLSLP
ncbi:hypothetical protein Vafri_1652, partial [Volvox africanus]